jgi:hypothetical protein
MDVAEWQKQLDDTFSDDGIIGKRLLNIIEMEKKYVQYIMQKFNGYQILTDSFFDFYIETLNQAHRQLMQNGRPQGAYRFPVEFLFYVTNFKSLRAAENLFLCGYPFDGYALLRDLKDRAIFLGAIMHRISTFSTLYLGLDEAQNGHGTLSEEDYRKIRKQREKEEKRVHTLMLGAKSGLEETIIHEIKKWEQYFHEEVHGSHWTFFIEGGPWLNKEKALSLGPEPNDVAMGMYINRSNEIKWMILKSMPFLQLSAQSFGNEWARKWHVLDNAFRFTIEELGKMDKKIAWAVLAMVDQKFHFSPEKTYFEVAE